MRLTALHSFGIRSFLFLLPIFGLWWFITIYMLSILALPVGTTITHWFEREQVTLEITPTSWYFHTKVLAKNQPSKTKTLQSLYLKIENNALLSFIMGFPLIWTLLIAIPEPLIHKPKKLLLGTFLLSIPVTLTLSIRIIYLVAAIFIGDNVGQIMVMDGLYQTVHPYSPETMAILAWLTKLLAYANFIAFPIFITYLLNQQFAKDLFHSV